MHDVVELGLRTAGGPTQASKLGVKELAEAFLKLFADFTPEADGADVRSFLHALEGARAQIAQSDHGQDVRRLAASAVRACGHFLKQSRHYYQTRESELTDMIGILGETAKLLAGDSTEFSTRMRATIDRFQDIAQLDDIRELKKHLTEEAGVLQQTVAEKLQHDQQAVSALTARVQSLQAHLVEAEEQASLDPLTRIANRGRFDHSITRMIKAARSANTPISIALVDIDHFKGINDTHGHAIGDRVLLCAAQWLTGAVRHTDLVARYGGEEFGVILADSDLVAAETRFRAVIEQIASRSFEYDLDGENRSIRFTVSCGLAQLTGTETEADLVRRADEALYAAKRGGRNRVVARKRSKLSGLFG